MKPETEQFKKKRQQFAINMRKTNRENTLMKRRMQPPAQSADNPKVTIIVDDSFHTFLKQALSEEYDLNQLPQIAQLLKSENIYDKHKAVIGLRKVSASMSPQVEQFVQVHGLVRFLAGWCDQSHYPQLKFEIFDALTNMSSFSKELCKQIVQAQYIPLICGALGDQNQNIVYQAIWLAANLAADETQYRDEFIEGGAVMKILQFLEGNRKNGEIVTATWALTNLARGEPKPKYESIKFIGPIVAQSIKSGVILNEQILSDCLWTLSHLSDGPKVRIARIMETNVLPYVMKYLSSSNLSLSLPSLRIVGNFTSGTKEQTNQVLNHQFFDYAIDLLNHSKPIMVKQTCWTLSNITAGTQEQILRFMQRNDLIEALLQIYPKYGNDVKMEIVWVFTNLEKAEVPELILRLFELIKIVDMLGELIQDTNVKVLVDALTCLHRVFNHAEKCRVEPQDGNRLVTYFMEQHYTQHLERLQSNPSDKVFSQCSQIIQKFFDVTQPVGMVDE